MKEQNESNIKKHKMLLSVSQDSFQLAKRDKKELEVKIEDLIAEHAAEFVDHKQKLLQMESDYLEQLEKQRNELISNKMHGEVPYVLTKQIDQNNKHVQRISELKQDLDEMQLELNEKNEVIIEL